MFDTVTLKYIGEALFMLEWSREEISRELTNFGQSQTKIAPDPVFNKVRPSVM
jgi:hypothetical protein